MSFKIIISPAKKMCEDLESIEPFGLPRYIERTQDLADKIRTLSTSELKALWKCNDGIVEQNRMRFLMMDMTQRLTPAILSYEGIQYKYMAPAVFEESMLSYIQSHLYILSGFYGILKPMDGVVPYRLELQAKLSMQGHKDLYDFWGRTLYEEVTAQVQVIINLASKEYSKSIEQYLKPEDIFITCIFGELVDGKVIQKGTYAKMARGEMVRFMAENQMESVEELKRFDRLGYQFDEERSTKESFVFIKENGVGSD
ncbi:MAG: peroxide stress protein YaaA [Lachnospiraceae bacterium]